MKHGRVRGLALLDFLVASACALVVASIVLGACCALGRVLVSQEAAAAHRAEAMAGLEALRDAIEWAGSLGVADAALAVTGLPGQASRWPVDLQFSPGQAIAGGTLQADVSPRDIIAVRGVVPAGGVLRDCPAIVSGRDGAQARVSLFAVRNGHLLCQSSVGGREGTVALAAAVALRLRYGLDLNHDGAVDRYLDAAQVDAAHAWGAVRSVEITLDFTAGPRARASRLRQIVALRARLPPMRVVS